MTEVVGVKFNDTGKVYYFSRGDLQDIRVGGGVIVETARGLEYGTVAMGPTEVQDYDVIRPLKQIVRLATESDEKRRRDNEEKKEESLAICQEKILKHGLDMKLIDVEYTFDNNKVVFYFTADGRVDFRELVKDLAAVFHMRIELRQIGVRDEAKLVGGCGPCGRALCCASWMADFQPVSIKMAKTQNLSLNPTKISGICGRLMCCLKYENEAYIELRRGMPEPGERVRTEDGEGRVVDGDLLQGKVRVRLYTDERDEDGAAKLSDDIYIYSKDDVKRLGRQKRDFGSRGSEQKRTGRAAQADGHNDADDSDIIAEAEEYKEELAELVKD